MKGPTFALLALMAATATVAQQTTPSTTAEPPASATPQEQNTTPTTPPSDSSSSSNSADAQALMQDCLSQVKAANPNVPDQDIRRFCENEISKAQSTAPKD
jgi:hypothetical protein